MNKLAAELELEKKASADLRDLVNTQRVQIEQSAIKAKEAEEKLSTVFAEMEAQSRFLQNLGVVHTPMNKHAAELELEKKTSADLQDLVNTQRVKVEQIASKAKEAEEKVDAIFDRMDSLLSNYFQQRQTS